MLHLRNSICFIVLFISFNFFGQTLKDQFYALHAQKDTTGQKKVLEKWETEAIEDPELYIAYFNYYIGKSKDEVLHLGNTPEGKEAIQLVNQDSSSTEPISFIYEESGYDLTILNKGFEWISKGLKKFPDRLDMRFGEIYMYGQIEAYEDFTLKIIETVDYSHTIGNKWKWTDNEALPDAKNFMLNSIQDYQVQLYYTEDSILLEKMKFIAEKILNYYPDHIESLSNVSIVYLIQQKYDQALSYLLKAENLNDKDYIILSNIAFVYKSKGDQKNALKYYKLSVQYGDKETKSYAEEQIKILEAK